MVVLFSALIILILLIQAGLFQGPPSYTGELCSLEDIKLQKDFDKEKFSGVWYGTYTKGLDSKVLAALLEFTDVKINFQLKKDGNFDLKSVGGKFLGLWCPEGEGHADIRDDATPQKLSIYFDTPTGKKFGTKAGWIIATDYTSYAVIYSCWEETADGMCTATGAYAGVIQRKKGKLSASAMDEVRTALQRSCINHDALRPIVHQGNCKSAQAALEH